MNEEDNDIRGPRADGSEFPVDISIINATDEQPPFLVAIVRDATHRAEREREWAKLADTDPLTGILNRRALLASAETMAAAAERRGDSLGLALIDIDDFKRINDTAGHAAGDDVLTAVTKRIESNLRDADLLGRWGGEELVAVLSDTDKRAAVEASERLRASLVSEPIDVPSFGTSMPVTVSIGVTVSSQASGRIAGLIDCADVALYDAKQDGKNCVRLEIDGNWRPKQHRESD